VRLNGAALNARVEIKVEFYEDIKLRDILKQACKEMKNKDAYRQAKLYNRKGLQIQEDDVSYINPGEILYIALNGKLAADSHR
jgi:hypothetical protein